MTEETLARWKAEEEAVRTRLAPRLGCAAEQVSGRSGMEVFEAIFAGELPRPPIGDTLDFVPIHIEPGLAVFQGRPQPSTTTRSASCTAAGSLRCSIRRWVAQCIPLCPPARPTRRWN